ncbi:hypothetical protein [Streptomyces sp. H27-D2]|uniref:hypothetical protein n=1 Tax=Streptomyces sp. H27-D2 TaxID=3046304 RepID=UPI002DC03E3B|nr:hypothetical protein [Streptomyces sp. H27-D2]MEC4019585.1 hypothetical protein [Streptomyces sp. H27-D2]
MVCTAAVLLLGSGAVGCGDDSGGVDRPPKASATPSKTPGDETGEPSTAGGSAPSDPAAAKKQVAKNWRKFFDPAVPEAEKLKVLEDGDRMKPVLKGFNGDKRGGQVEAKVSKVTFSSPTEADVRYALMLKGQTALPGAAGTSVRQDKVWKVSVKTLCALVKLSGNAPKGPGC